MQANVFLTAGLNGSRGHPLTLRGDLVELLPLTLSYAKELLEIASLERSSFTLTYVPSTLPAMEDYVTRALLEYEQGRTVPLVIVNRQGGKVIGTSRFCDIEYWDWPHQHPLRRSDGTPDVLAVGYTWIAPSWQGSEPAREARQLMLSHAFEVWKVYRLSIRTDERNLRSRRAIEKIGGKLDGIVRAHMLACDGQIRNTALYSILRDEWIASSQISARASGS